MRSNTYLTFEGQCEAAFQFYQQCLGGKIEALHKFSGTPAAEHVPADWRDKVMHACLNLGNDRLMGSDSPPGLSERPAGFSVALQFTDPGEAERMFGALSEGGQIRMPLSETFWAVRFGMFVDRFGVPWMINCGKEA